MKSQVVEVVVVLAAVVVSSSAHSIGFGACPRLRGMKNFEPGKFAGFWYAIEMYSTFSRCVTLDFARISKDDFKVTEGKEYAVAQFVGIEHVFSNTGIYASRAPKDPAKFEVKWSNNVFGAADGTIINTDYEQYAVVLECQRVFYFMKRTSALILSRSRKLDYEIIRKLKQDLCKTYNLNIQNFEAVSQDRCATTPLDTAHQKRMSLMGGNARVSGVAQYPPAILSSPRNATKPQPTKPAVRSLQPARPSAAKPQPTRPSPAKKPVKPSPAPKPHVLRNASSTQPQRPRPTPGRNATSPKPPTTRKPPVSRNSGTAKPQPRKPAVAGPSKATTPKPAKSQLAKPTPAKPSPAKPTPAKPTPAKPTPAKPTPAKPTPAKPTPAKPTPAKPTPAKPLVKKTSRPPPRPPKPSAPTKPKAGTPFLTPKPLPGPNQAQNGGKAKPPRPPPPTRKASQPTARRTTPQTPRASSTPRASASRRDAAPGPPSAPRTDRALRSAAG
ncbi:uncharacterized protein [Penaeus vannamei]|uniref:uncharacterized protein n=1 Tax=Penaeus vannamei TaxID=6689 RepID=UPI00387F6908